MLHQSLAFGFFVLTTLILELVGWWCFRSKMNGIDLPRELDASFFRFFSFTRMRVIAIIHTVFMLAVLIPSFLFLW